MTNTNTTKTEIALLEQTASIELTSNGQVVLHNIGEALCFANLMARGAMLPQKVTPEQATISIIAGARLGLDPFQSVQSIAVINGRPALWGDGMVAIVKSSGLVEDEQIEYLPNYKECKGVRVRVKRKGVKTAYEGLFSLEDAKQAGLLGRGVWASYTRRMLLNRARAFAYRDGFADVLKGFRSAEEEQDVELIEKNITPVAETKKKGKSALDTVFQAVANNESQADLEEHTAQNSEPVEIIPDEPPVEILEEIPFPA